jgi:hypothetical protein
VNLSCKDSRVTSLVVSARNRHFRKVGSVVESGVIHSCALRSASNRRLKWLSLCDFAALLMKDVSVDSFQHSAYSTEKGPLAWASSNEASLFRHLQSQLVSLCRQVEISALGVVYPPSDEPSHRPPYCKALQSYSPALFLHQSAPANLFDAHKEISFCQYSQTRRTGRPVTILPFPCHLPCLQRHLYVHGQISRKPASSRNLGRNAQDGQIPALRRPIC